MMEPVKGLEQPHRSAAHSSTTVQALRPQIEYDYVLATNTSHTSQSGPATAIGVVKQDYSDGARRTQISRDKKAF